MNYRLVKRTEAYVENFWNASKDEGLRAIFPFMDLSLEESLELFKASNEPGATSFGRSIIVDDIHVGDVWCYAIDEKNEKSCFLSIVIFNKEYWGKGLGSKVTSDFLGQVSRKYMVDKVCAFTYEDNVSSKTMLEKVGFEMKESFVEDGRPSLYFEYQVLR